MCVDKDVDVHALPFNRHKRRRLIKARRVMINLFVCPNPQWWQNKVPSDVEVLNVDILGGQNLLDDNTMSFLIQAAREGSLLMMTAGPPCRSVSVCRHKEDGGPRPIRAREGEERWCAAGLLPHERHLAQEDAQLWLRTLVLLRIGKQHNPKTMSLVETPADPCTYM